MRLKRFNGLVSVLKLFFLLLCVTVIDMAVKGELFTSEIHGADLLKSEVGNIDQENLYKVAGGIKRDGGNKNALADDHSFQRELSQNDKGEESSDNENEKAEGVGEQVDVKGKGRGMDLQPIQYCQGKFKRLGGSGVEIITIRCPKVDDSCHCEGDKKSPTKWVECSDVRKDSTIGSDLLSCESKIVGSGAAASSE